MSFPLFFWAVFFSVFSQLIAFSSSSVPPTQYRNCGNNLLPQSSPLSFSKAETKPKDLGISIWQSREAKQHEWPWAVSLGTFDLVNSSAYQPRCSGALFADDWLITSGTCLEAIKTGPNLVTVAVIGAHNISFSAANEPGKQVVPIIQQVFHPRFRHRGLPDEPVENDIALAQLEYSLDMMLPDSNPYLWPVCLPNQTNETSVDNPYIGKSGTIYGWGEREPDFDVMSNVLFVTDLNVFECDAGYQYITPVVCIAGRFNGFCEGDIGGPLMVKSNNNGVDKWTAVAVANHPGYCSEEGLISYLTLIGPYVDWIWQTVEKNLK